MKNIITVSREFGSGGRSIAKAVAEALGYAYYDKELIEELAKQSGLSREFIEKSAEYAPGASKFSYAFVGRTLNGMSVEDYLWKEQRELIRKLAEKGKCVIVGRCADYILRDRADCLNAFIHADMEKRMERVVKLYGETDENPKKRLTDKDKKRKINYKYYTDGQWGASANYHISLDSGEIGIERCADILCRLAKEL